MVFQIDPVTAAALLGNPEVSVRVQVITPTQVATIPVIEDQSGVSYDGSSMQVRNATLMVARAITDLGYFNPLSDQVYINVNVSGGQDIPLFYGRVQTTNETSAGNVQITCIDHADDLAGASFNVPWTTHGGTVAQEINALISDVNGTFSADFTLVSSQVANFVPNLSWESDRTRAIDDLARGVLIQWRASRVGGFDFYPNPFASSTYDLAAMFTDGVNGTLIDMQYATSRRDIYNSITVIVERSDGSDPVRVTVFDADPTSATLYGGPFDIRNKNFSIQTPLNVSAAFSLAVRILRSSLALTETWTWTVPYAPHLDPGDVVGLTYRNKTSPVVIDTVGIALSAKQGTRFTGRRLRLLDPSVIGEM